MDIENEGSSSISSIPIYKYKKNPSNFNIFCQLTKKQFLVKIRSASSIIEYLFSFSIFVILIGMDKYSSEIIPADLNPEPVYSGEGIPFDIAYFFLSSNKTQIIAGPKTPHVISLMNFLYSNLLKYQSAKVEYSDDEKQIFEAIDESSENSFGIFWENSEADDNIIHPIIRTYLQSNQVFPTYSIFRIIRSFFSLELLKTDTQNQEFNKLVFLNSSLQKLASTESNKFHFDTQIPCLFIGSIIVLLTMPSCEILAQELFTKLSSLYFLMGCNEAIYYLAFFVNEFIFSFVLNLIMSLLFCYCYLLTNVSFTLFFSLNILYSLAFISLTLFILSFFRSEKAALLYSSSMLIFNIIVVVLITFEYQEVSKADITSCKILYVFPQFGFISVIRILRVNSLFENVHVGWSNLKIGNESDIAFVLYMLAVDTVMYLLLFLISRTISKHWSSIQASFKKLFKRKSSLINNEHNSEGDRLFDINGSNRDFFIRVKDLSKSYLQIKKKRRKLLIDQDDLALKSVSFDVKKNEIIVVAGPNGAGKTTLINILSGVVRPTSGTLELNSDQEIEKDISNLELPANSNVKFEGDNDNSLSEYLLKRGTFSECLRTDDFTYLQRFLGVVFQENVFVLHLSVRENLFLFGTLRGVHKEDIESFIEFFADALQMRDSLFKLAKDLSGGQKRKLSLAIALIGDPAIMLMDEPTSGVDVQGRQLIWKFIASLKTTAIITTHELEEAEAASSRIFIINKGKIPFKGNPAELRDRFQCGYMIKFENGPLAAHDALNVIQSEVLSKKGLNVDLAKIRRKVLDTIYIPICPEVADCLCEIDKKKEELNIGSYSIYIEQLEDLILSSEDLL